MAEEDKIDIQNEEVSSEDLEILNSDFKDLSDEIPKDKEPEKIEKTEQNDNSKSEEDDEDQLGPEHDDKTEEEREAIRARRRKERADKKKFRQEKEASYQREIAGLKKQLSEFNEWKNTVERRSQQSGMAQLDNAIRETDDTLELAKRSLAEATQSQNGEAIVDAQELYYAARKRKEDLERIKAQVSQQNQRQQPPTIDPMVVKKAQQWMAGKDWYDPALGNEDTQIMVMLDKKLNSEGWDPRTQEYWDELDERAKKYLPHRYEIRSNRTEQTQERRPPTGGSGGGNRQSSTQAYTLSSERVRALKESGMWDDPVKRKQMIKRYMEHDKSNKP